jgi:large subunit ribosomal protein L15
MNLHEVNKGVEKHKKRLRIGRGVGSGRGKTSGKGHKGAKAMSGYDALPIFSGGGTPLVRAVPKRGFNNKRFAVKVVAVNVGDLEELFNAGEEVTLVALKEKNAARGRYDELKILGDGELTKKLIINAHRFSKSAKEKIEKAGGTMNVLPVPITVGEKREKLKAEGKLKSKSKLGGKKK